MWCNSLPQPHWEHCTPSQHQMIGRFKYRLACISSSQRVANYFVWKALTHFRMLRAWQRDWNGRGSEVGTTDPNIYGGNSPYPKKTQTYAFSGHKYLGSAFPWVFHGHWNIPWLSEVAAWCITVGQTGADTVEDVRTVISTFSYKNLQWNVVW